MTRFSSLLKQSKLFNLLASHGGRKGLLKAVAQNMSQEFGPSLDKGYSSTGASASQAPTGTVTLPEQTVYGNLPIPKNVQKMLSDICFQNKWIKEPLEIDGKMGPLTLNALKLYKEKFVVPKNWTNKEVFESIMGNYQLGSYDKSSNPSNKTLNPQEIEKLKQQADQMIAAYRAALKPKNQISDAEVAKLLEQAKVMFADLANKSKDKPAVYEALKRMNLPFNKENMSDDAAKKLSDQASKMIADVKNMLGTGSSVQDALNRSNSVVDLSGAAEQANQYAANSSGLGNQNTSVVPVNLPVNEQKR